MLADQTKIAKELATILSKRDRLPGEEVQDAFERRYKEVHDAVDRNLREISNMDNHAKRTEAKVRAINPLLLLYLITQTDINLKLNQLVEFKNAHGSKMEARLTLAQTLSAARQNQAVLAFTIVTMVFVSTLPYHNISQC